MGGLRTVRWWWLGCRIHVLFIKIPPLFKSLAEWLIIHTFPSRLYGAARTATVTIVRVPVIAGFASVANAVATTFPTISHPCMEKSGGERFRSQSYLPFKLLAHFASRVIAIIRGYSYGVLSAAVQSLGLCSGETSPRIPFGGKNTLWPYAITEKTTKIDHHQHIDGL